MWLLEFLLFRLSDGIMVLLIGIVNRYGMEKGIESNSETEYLWLDARSIRYANYVRGQKFVHSMVFKRGFGLVNEHIV